MKKGFSLIELLVVISTIGLLSSVVLANIKSSSDKGYDAKVKSSLVNVRSEVFVITDGDGYAAGFCGTKLVSNLIDSIPTTICQSNASAWAIYIPLKKPVPGATGLCLDNSGLINQRTTLCGVSCTIGGPCMP